MGHTIILNEKIILNVLKKENLNLFNSSKTCFETLHFLIYMEIKKQLVDSGITVKNEDVRGQICNKKSLFDMKTIVIKNESIEDESAKLENGLFLNIGETSFEISDTERTYISSNKDTIIDSKYCCSYGHDDYSIEALNYLNEKIEIPTLNNLLSTTEKYINFGNYKFLVENNDIDIKIQTVGNLNLIGYSYDIAKNKRKSYITLLGLWLNKEFFKYFNFDILDYNNIDKHYLQEIQLLDIQYPIIYTHKITGCLYTCTCFEASLKNRKISSYSSYSNKFTVKSLKEIKFVKNLCNFCTGGIPKLDYGGIYGSIFLRKYYPYYHMLFLEKYNGTPYEFHKDKNKLTEMENKLREHFDYPKIGERWISETTLFKIVEYLFSDKEVVFHYRGKELEGLELDIWIADINVGIEYQGEQHYKVIEHWGGEEGLKKRITNDKKKKKLCKALNYTLIEVKYDENITEQLVIDKLKGFI